MNIPSNKKLVTFVSADGAGYDFYALVNAHTDDKVITELTAAAISDANKQGAENELGSVDFTDTPPTPEETQEYGTQAIIKRLLTPLGFEFLESIETACWDSHEQEESLMDVRLRHAGIIGITKTSLVDFVIQTDKGAIELDAETGAWRCIPEKEGDSTLTGDGFYFLTALVHQRGQLNCQTVVAAE